MSAFSKEKWIETGGRVYVDAENYNAMVERVRELQEHFDGCAGAEATINDWRARAEAAEARVKELEALLRKQAGSWTLCTVCGATARNAPAKEIVHHAACALARALG